MLTKRIIPCLDIKNGRTVKGVNFVNLQDAGDPVELAELYASAGADELVFLDISATEEKRKTLADLVYRVAEKVNIPFTVGGGIRSVEDVDGLLQNEHRFRSCRLLPPLARFPPGLGRRMRLRYDEELLHRGRCRGL